MADRQHAADQVWLDGTLVGSTDAALSVFDRGFTLGEGVFETIKATDGRPFAVRRHLERLRRSADALDLEIGWTDEDLRSAIEDAIGGAILGAVGPTPGGATHGTPTAEPATDTPRPTARGAPLLRVRITVTGGSAPLDPQRAATDERRTSTVVAAGPYTPWSASARLCTVPWPWNERSPLAGVKTTSHAEHVLAQAHARGLGCDEAVFANTRGDLCEGAGSNVFVVVGGRLLTPGLASGCLPGVTRALVLEITDAEEADLPVDVLSSADEVFLTSSTRDVQAVGQVDGRDLGPAGPATLAAAAAFADLASSRSDP